MATTRWFRVVAALILGALLAARGGATEESANVSGEVRIVPDFSEAALLRALLPRAMDGYLVIVVEPAPETFPVRSRSFEQLIPMLTTMDTRRDWLDEIPDLGPVRYPYVRPWIPGIRKSAGN